MIYKLLHVLQFQTKDDLAQDFILHDSLLRGKSALDQVAQGLEDAGVLSLVRLFPAELIQWGGGGGVIKLQCSYFFI